MAEICDGDARIALGALELAILSRDPGDDHNICADGPTVISLEDIKNGIKVSFIRHYNQLTIF